MSQETTNKITYSRVTEKVLLSKNGDTTRIYYDPARGDSKPGRFFAALFGALLVLLSIVGLTEGEDMAVPVGAVGLWLMYFIIVKDVAFVEIKRPEQQKTKAQVFLGRARLWESKKPINMEGFRRFSAQEFKHRFRGSEKIVYHLVVEYQSGPPVELIRWMNQEDAQGALHEIKKAFDLTSL